MSTYDDLKVHNGKVYTGMKIGGSHNWIYPEGKWKETKVAPDRWEFEFESIKQRSKHAVENTGARTGTTYHWYIIADQKATKVDSDSYKTMMNGLKFKIGHKRPHWRTFSYDYDDQPSYRERVIQVLEEALGELRKQ
jgi:hypothetical protein